MKKIALQVPRVFLGFIFFAFGVAGLLHLLPEQPAPQGIAGVYMQALGGTYLFTLVKLTEVVGGALLLSNRLTALGAVLLAPVVINILAFHALVVSEGVALPVVLLAALLFVAWQQRASYRPLLSFSAPDITPASR